MTQVRGSDGNVWAYTYNAAGALTEVKVTDPNGGTVHDYQYSYDAAGNLTKQTDGTSGQTLTYNAGEEMTQAGSTSYAYDANGNLASTSSDVAYTWDPTSQMDAITLANGASIGLGYAGPGAAITTYGSTSYTSDAVGQNSMTTSSGTTTFTDLPDGTPISESLSSGTYYYLDNGQGSVAAITGAAGSVADSYSYDPQGNILSQSGSVSNPYTYQDGQYDPATGLYLMPDGTLYNPTTTQNVSNGFFADMEGESELTSGGPGLGDGSIDSNPPADPPSGLSPETVAQEAAAELGGTVSPAKGNGWTIDIPFGRRSVVVRVMEAGAGGRERPYYKSASQVKSL